MTQDVTVIDLTNCDINDNEIKATDLKNLTNLKKLSIRSAGIRKIAPNAFHGKINLGTRLRLMKMPQHSYMHLPHRTI